MNMALTNRSNPSNQIEKYSDPFDQLFAPLDVFPFGSLTSRLMNEVGHPIGTSVRQFTPLLCADLIESETDFHINCDLPGVNKEDLDISFSDGQMLIKAERKEVHRTSSDTFRKIERNFGKIQRSIILPKNADYERAEATLKDGVLTITFPKIEVKKSTKIEVK